MTNKDKIKKYAFELQRRWAAEGTRVDFFHALHIAESLLSEASDHRNTRQRDEDSVNLAASVLSGEWDEPLGISGHDGPSFIGRNPGSKRPEDEAFWRRVRGSQESR